MGGPRRRRVGMRAAIDRAIIAASKAGEIQNS
jgi:hypothetical protein